MIRKIALPIALLAAVALINFGCTKQEMDAYQALQSFTVNQSQLDAVRNAYDGSVLTELTAYARLPRCAAGQTFLKDQCHDKALLKQLRAYDQQVGPAFDAVQAQLTSGNAAGAGAAWATVRTGVSAVVALLKQGGIPVPNISSLTQ